MKDCNQCGKCCIKYGNGALSASQAEIDAWELFEPDIFAYVKDGEIWCDPSSGRRLSLCPFLMIADKQAKHENDKYICGIYDSRPQDCRLYPSLISEMVADECEMLEVSDIQNPHKAQQTLNVIMIDSHH